MNFLPDNYRDFKPLVREEAVVNDAGQIMKAGCVVINDDMEILLVEYHQHGFWGFPKGHMDAGESAAQAALRETFEETGYEVTIVKRLPDLDYKSQFHGYPVSMAVFLAQPIAKTGEPEEKCCWVKLSDAPAILKEETAAFLALINDQTRLQ